MTPIKGAHIVTLHNPAKYTTSQIDQAVAIAHILDRGQFVLCAEPKR